MLTIRGMKDCDEYFVGTCTHVNDTPECHSRCEINYSAKRRIAWLQSLYHKRQEQKLPV